MQLALDEVQPACIAQSVVQGEAGRSRLLLSTETMHYVIYSMVIELTSSKQGQDVRVDRGLEDQELSKDSKEP